MNLIVSVAIILLNLYVAYGISCQIPMLFCQYTFRMFQLPFVWKQIQKFLMSCILVIRHLWAVYLYKILKVPKCHFPIGLLTIKKRPTNQ